MALIKQTNGEPHGGDEQGSRLAHVTVRSFSWVELSHCVLLVGSAVYILLLVLRSQCGLMGSCFVRSRFFNK